MCRDHAFATRRFDRFLICISIYVEITSVLPMNFPWMSETPSVYFLWNWAYFQKHLVKSRIFLRELGWSMWTQYAHCSVGLPHWPSTLEWTPRVAVTGGGVGVPDDLVQTSWWIIMSPRPPVPHLPPNPGYATDRPTRLRLYDAFPFLGF